MGYIGENIRRERINAGFDQVRLARALGLDQTAISRFENGSRRPSVDLLKRIAAELGCPFEVLVSEEFEAVDDARKIVEEVLAQNPGIKVQMRSLVERSDKIAPEDWQFLASHLMHAFGCIGLALDRREGKGRRGKAQ